MKKQKGIHPCFGDKLICVDTFRNFTKDSMYEITGFGTDMRKGKKESVWWVCSLDFKKEEFTIIKTSLNTLIDSKILKIDYD